MLNDLSPVPVHGSPSQTERAAEVRGRSSGKSVRPGRSPSLEDRPRSTEKPASKARETTGAPGEALEFRREDSSMHRLYESTRETVEMSRKEKVEQLRQAVKNGTYRPNLMVVAERVLSSGELGHT